MLSTHGQRLRQYSNKVKVGQRTKSHEWGQTKQFSKITDTNGGGDSGGYKRRESIGGQVSQVIMKWDGLVDHSDRSCAWILRFLGHFVALILFILHYSVCLIY